MSTKTTIRKRISLTAIGALMTGLLTVVGGSNAQAAVATDANVSEGVGSLGIVSGTVASSAVTMTVDGQLAITVATSNFAILVTGGTITNPGTTTVSSANTLNASRTEMWNLTGAGNSGDNIIFKPTAAGTNMVIKVYASGAGTAAAVSAGAGLAKTITVTVVSAASTGVYNAGTSYVSIQAIGSGTATIADVPYENTVKSGTEVRINYSWKDALGTALSASTFTVGSVTSGACVIGTSAGGGTLGVASEYATSGDFYVGTADGESAANCTVTISSGGVVRSTKSLIFTGAPAKINFTAAYRGKTSTDNTSAATGKGYVTVTDSAGNTLGGINVLPDTTKYDGIVSTVAISNSGYTAYRASDTATSVRYPAAAGSTPSSLNYTCTAAGGDTSVYLKWTSASGGTVISSGAIPVSCVGNADSYTASLDKASYAPGDIATLTVTAKDSKGRLTHDAQALGSGLSLVGSVMTAVQTPSSTDLFENGIKTYKYQVGATEGSYTFVVDLPAINAVSITGQKAVTVAYKVAATTTVVSNADVLKSIVALIASINKQIQALQKLILARK